MVLVHVCRRVRARLRLPVRDVEAAPDVAGAAAAGDGARGRLRGVETDGLVGWKKKEMVLVRE